MNDSIPLPPGPPDWLQVNIPNTGKPVKPDPRAYKEVTLMVGRCECLRCGNIWYTKQGKRPVSCSKCHSAYWDRQPKWKQRTKEQREVEKKARKEAKIKKQEEVNKRLHESLEKLLIEEGLEGPEADRVSRKSIKNLLDTFRHSEKQSSGDQIYNSEALEVLDAKSRILPTDSSSFSERRSDAEFSEKTQGSAGVSLSHWDDFFQNQILQTGQSNDDRVIEDADDPGSEL